MIDRRSRTSRCDGRRHSCGHDRPRASPSKHCSVRLVAASATTRPPYLSGPILKIVTSPSPSSARKASLAASAICNSCGQEAFSSGASMPRSRTRVFRSRPAQMHPRLEGIAVDGSEHIDGVTHIRIAGPLPDHLGVARRRLSAGCDDEPAQRATRCSQCRTGSIVPATTPSHEHPGQRRRKPAAP